MSPFYKAKSRSSRALRKTKKRAFAQLSQEGQFNALSDASDEEITNFWNNLSKEELAYYWGRLNQDEKEKYFQFILEHFRAECYVDLSEAGRSNNFKYLPESERTLERYRELLDPGMNFQYLSARDQPEVYAQLDEFDRVFNFRLLSSIWKLRFWHMLPQWGKDICFGDLPREGRSERFPELSNDGKEKWAPLRPTNPVNWNVEPRFWTGVQFNEPEVKASSSHE